MNQDAKEWPLLNEIFKHQESSRSLSIITKESYCFRTPILKQQFIRKRPFFRILKKGSLTVEAAIAVPLFFMVTLCIASIMGIYTGTMEKMTSLRDTCEKLAVASSVTGEDLWMDISEPQSFTPFCLPQGVSLSMVMCRGKARCWTGRSSDDAESISDEKSSTYVYLTENQSVYHTSSQCTHLDLSIHSVSSSNVENMRNSGGAKYKPCERCVRGNETGSIVYITDDGDRYHASAGCSGLKRTVRMVDIDEVGDLRECSRCASHS